MHRLGNLRRNSRAGHSFLAFLERNPSSEPATRILLRFGLRLVIRLRLYRSPVKILPHNANTMRLRPMPCYSQDRPPVALLGCTPRHLRHMATTRQCCDCGGPLLLRPQQLLKRRIVAQRLEREVGVQRVSVRVPLSERLPEQSHGAVPLAQQRRDTRPPHGGPAEQIRPRHPLERLCYAERLDAVSLARRCASIVSAAAAWPCARSSTAASSSTSAAAQPSMGGRFIPAAIPRRISSTRPSAARARTWVARICGLSGNRRRPSSAACSSRRWSPTRCNAEVRSDQYTHHPRVNPRSGPSATRASTASRGRLSAIASSATR